MQRPIIVRELGLRDYSSTWQAMRYFTDHRTPESPDEIWVLQHNPVFTQGQSGKAEHVLFPGDIPVVQADGVGQVPYHGPGQRVLYLLLDVRQLDMGVRALVTLIEDSLIAVLASYGVTASAKPEAPGVYVDGSKIASLGLRIRNGRSFHGLALNVDMDLEPFRRINPCGYAGLTMTQLRDWVETVEMTEVSARLVAQLTQRLGYAEQKTLVGGIESYEQ